MRNPSHLGSPLGLTALYFVACLAWLALANGDVLIRHAGHGDIAWHLGGDLAFLSGSTALVYFLFCHSRRQSDARFAHEVLDRQIQAVVARLHRNLSLGSDSTALLCGVCTDVAAIDGLREVWVSALDPGRDDSWQMTEVCRADGCETDATQFQVAPPELARTLTTRETSVVWKPIAGGGWAIYLPVFLHGNPAYVLTLTSGDRQLQAVSVESRFNFLAAELTRALERHEELHAHQVLVEENFFQSRLMQSVFDSTDSLIALVDRDLRYRFTNRTYELWWGIDSPARRGLSVPDVLGAERVSALQPFFDQALAGKTVDKILDGLTLRKGTIESVRLHLSPMFTSQGDVDGFVVMVTDNTSAYQAEQARRSVETRFRRYVEGCPLGVIVTTRDGIVLEANQAAEKVFGFGAGAMVGNRFDVCGAQDATEEIPNLLERAAREGGAAGEIPLISADGHRFWGSVTAARLATEEVIFFVEDVSEEHAWLHQVLVSEARWQFALEGSDQGVWDWDIASHQVFFSPRWKSMLGYGDEEIGNSLREWSDRVAPEDMPGIQTAIDAHFRGETEIYENIHRVRTKDGTYRWILDRGKIVERGEGGTPLRMIGTHTDVTRMREMQEALQASEIRANLILNCAPDGMLLVDQDGLIVRANPQVAKTFGYPIEAMTNLPLAELLPPEIRARHAQHLLTFAKAPQPRSMGKGLTLRGYRRDGTQFPVKVSLAPVVLDGVSMTIASVVDVTLEAEQQLTLSRYKDIVNISADGLVFIDRDERYLVVNPAFCAIYNLPREAILGHRAEEVVGPATYREIAPKLAAARAGEVVRFRSARQVAAGFKHFDLEYRPFRQDGAVRGIVCWARDITDEIAAEYALAQTRDALERAQGIAHLGTWATDFATRMTEFSVEAQRILRFSTPSVPWRDFIALIHPEDVARYREAWHKATTSGQLDCELRLRIGEGNVWIHLTAEAVAMEGNRLRTATGILQDTTEIRTAQAALEAARDNLEVEVAARTAALSEARNRLSSILESTADGIFGLDQDGVITFANPAARRLLGHDESSIVGQPAHETIHYQHPDGSSYPVDECPMHRALSTGTVAQSIEEVFWRADGTALPVIYSAQPIIQDDRIVGAVASFMDRTAQAQAEAAQAKALKEAERLALARSTFLANMSHEMRTPLNAVLGFAQGGLRQTDDPVQRRTLQRIAEAGQVLLGVVNDVLDFSKIDAGKMELELTEVCVGDLIDRAVMLTAGRAHAKGLDLVVRESPRLPAQLTADPLRTVQILLNLLSNAVKFTEEGRVTLEVDWADDTLTLRVRDTGSGIDDETRSRLFKPFEQADVSTTRKFGGTGLGLAITTRLVTQMGGALDLVSTPGKGSCFEVKIPALGRPRPPSLVPRLPVVLHGFSPAQAEAYRTQLEADGIPAVVGLRSGAQFTEPLLLAPRPSLESIVDDLPSGMTLGILLLPGEHLDDVSTGVALEAFDWPLRTRHVRTVLEGEHLTRAEPTKRGQRLAGISILAAEDNEINRVVLEEIVASEGALLICEDNGHRAIEALRGADPGQFHVLLTDIQMPGIDGYETTRQAHSILPELPVIGLTAYADLSERQRCLACGMVDHIAKPIEQDRLVEAILRHVRREQAPRIDPSPELSVTEAGKTAPQEIDWATLNRRFRGKQSVIDRLLWTFLAQHRNVPDRLRSLALDARPDAAPQIEFIAHGLKSTAGALGATQIEALALEVQNIARDGASGLIPRTLALAEALARWNGVLTEHLGPESTDRSSAQPVPHDLEA
ncbi:MAG: PAS domain S-box protein [Zoogloeaceae bacterium]|nr:PAS domain S-box protein [Zoogloeaceae bacterium]